MKADNAVKVTFLSRSINESLARSIVSAFAAQADPALDELQDIKTAVSEAVTNCIIHAYPEQLGTISLSASLTGSKLRVVVADKGVGIEDVERAMTPMYTTGGKERAGLGFAVMQTFCDSIKVRSTPGKGTRITLTKTLCAK